MIKYFSFVALPITVGITLAGCQLPSITDSFKHSLGVSPSSALFDDSELSPRKAAEACIVTAEKLEAAGHRREAIGLYEKARQHDAKALDYSRRLAVLYDKEGDVANAAREYTQAIVNEPKSPDLLNDYGYFHLTQGDFAAAESHFRKAISFDENHQRAWMNLGITLAHQTRYQEAFDAFARVVGPAAAHSNVGAIMAKQGQVQQAKKAFQQALSLNRALRQPQAFLSYYAQHSSQPTATSASFTDN